MKKNESVICVPSSFTEQIADALVSGANCHRLDDAAGRGSVSVFPLPDGSKGIVRVSRRGGLMRFLFKDRFLLVNRPLKELSLTIELYNEGLPVPEPLGVFWKQKGPFYMGAVATRYIEAQDFVSANPANNPDILRHAGQAIRHLHDAGVFHADLHVHNLLVHNRDIIIIDLDKAYRCCALQPWQRAMNLLRLRRSFDKHTLPRTMFQTLLDAYGPHDKWPYWLEIVYYIRGAGSHLFTRK